MDLERRPIFDCHVEGQHATHGRQDGFVVFRLHPREFVMEELERP